MAPIVLTIAGSDSSGGAGIQADLRTFERLGVSGRSVVTAITAQTESRFLSIYPAPADIVTQQLSAVTDQTTLSAIKIGMVATLANVQAIIWFLKRFREIPIIIDPVLDASSGYPLIEQSALTTFENQLLPLATVVTPNLREAATLAKMQVANRQTMETAALNIYQRLQSLRGEGRSLAVIVKGGHLNKKRGDYYYDGASSEWIEGEIVKGSIHGSGCLYSSALTAFLAKGYESTNAAHSAKVFVTEELKRKAKFKEEDPDKHS